MNTLAIILLEVQAWKAILTIFGAAIVIILLESEQAEHFYENLGKNIRNLQRKLRHKKQKNKERNSNNMNIMKAMSKCIINGKTYDVPDNSSISIKNGAVFVNEHLWINTKTEFSNEPVINIEIHGSVEQANTGSGSITVNGNANFVQSSSGDIQVNGDVRGNVQTSSGDIECGDVGGDVRSVSGDIDCGDVAGEAHTKSGDIDQSSKPPQKYSLNHK